MKPSCKHISHPQLKSWKRERHRLLLITCYKANRQISEESLEGNVVQLWSRCDIGCNTNAAIRVRKSIDSRNSAIRNAFRISLRPSSISEPRHPSLRVSVDNLVNTRAGGCCCYILLYNKIYYIIIYNYYLLLHGLIMKYRKGFRQQEAINPIHQT